MFVLVTRADLRCLREAGAVPKTLLDPRDHDQANAEALEYLHANGITTT